MKSFRAKQGPLKKQPFFTVQEIEEMCLKELRALNFLPTEPSPIRVDRFVEKRFNVSISYDKLPDGILGFTKFGSNGVEEIVIASIFDEEGTVSSERRARTTIAHEAGHGLLHASLFAVERKSRNLFGESHDDTPRVLCREANAALKGVGRLYKGDWWEFQANMVMGSLLLPRPLVDKAMRPYLDSRGFFGSPVLVDAKREEAITALSNIFDVNPIVVRLRLGDVYPLTNSPQLSL